MKFVQSTYKVAPGGTSGFFKTGQNADILFSGIDFNNTGGPLLFNHPSGIASDGTRLFLTDTFNNRVLVWNALPTGNVPPDLVLGQKDFVGNNPGTGRDQMNWPKDVATDGKRLVVADTNNHRILIWNSLPTKSGAPADLVLQGGKFSQPGMEKRYIASPWGVWTNGEKLVVASTGGGSVLIWNRFPTQDNQPADIVLTDPGKMGTPRHITSDGKSLIVGDHNARVEGQPSQGSFFWKTFPTTDDQPFDFYMSLGVFWLRGGFTPEGKLLLLSNSLHIWNSFPQDAQDAPDQSLLPARHDWAPYLAAGDYGGLAIVGNKLYISAGNENKVVVYNSIPTQPDQKPDFAIGSPDLDTNTLETNFFIQNGVPASNGKSLFVSSDADGKLYVWKSLPDQSNAHPDIVYSLPGQPGDNALWGETLALAGRDMVYIWKKLPLNGELPDLTFTGGIGGVQFQFLKGVALDDRYFYLSDFQANKVYVWEGLPSLDSPPKFTLEVSGPWRLHSNGTYLLVAVTNDRAIKVFRVADLSPNVLPTIIAGPGRFSLPHSAIVVRGYLFVADTGNNRVLVWRNIEDALAGKWPPDVILGKNDLDDTGMEIGQNKLFMPAALSFDGSYLWVGERKFSNRLLRFSLSP